MMAKYVYVMNNQDTETNVWATRLGLDGFNAPLIGGTHPLGVVQNNDLLAIVAHGTAESAVSVKQGDKKRWTAGQLADQLVTDGISPDHKTIELLVCEAASSVNTVKNAAELGEMRTKYIAATDDATKKKLEQKFVAKAAEVPTLTDMSLWTTKYLLPFGASLVQELKNRDFKYVRVICYKYCVSAHFTEGKVWLQDPQGGDRKATDGDKVQWL
jgi:hypothetical protein